MLSSLVQPFSKDIDWDLTANQYGVTVVYSISYPMLTQRLKESYTAYLSDLVIF
jgi:hypothetical protein